MATAVVSLDELADRLTELSTKTTVVITAIEEVTSAIEGLTLGGAGGSTAVLITNTSTQAVPITGTIAVSEPVTIDGTVALDAASLAALETVNVGNLPAVQPVSDNGGSLTVDGTVAVSGTVPVSGTFWQATQPVSGTVSVTEPVSVDDNGGSLTVDGTVNVGNFPAAQPVTDNGGSLTVDGTVAVSNFPATQPVSGTVTGNQGSPAAIASAWYVRDGYPAMTWTSLKSAAPAANAVQADTGALAAGDYDVDIHLAVSDTVAVGKGLVIEHRNAANNATLANLGGVTPNGGAGRFIFRRYTLALNERIRVIAGTAAGAASSMYISAIGRRLT